MDKRLVLLPLIILILSIMASNSRATGSFYMGVPIVTDRSSWYWDEGIMLGIQQHYPLSKHVELGGQFGAHRFTAYSNQWLFVMDRIA